MIPGLGFPVASVSNPSRGTPARMAAAGVNSSVTSDVDDAMRKDAKQPEEYSRQGASAQLVGLGTSSCAEAQQLGRLERFIGGVDALGAERLIC
ncbi:hypothetical protein XhhCFBP4925_23240 [Xanthomonas hortorum pv. hederae]|nr:hypothetical protein XhhCFBP4925_23240 [Xanthomonas hortorum pv. hederae]